MNYFSEIVEVLILFEGLVFMFKYYRLKIRYKQLEEELHSMYMQSYSNDYEKGKF